MIECASICSLKIKGLVVVHFESPIELSYEGMNEFAQLYCTLDIKNRIRDKNKNKFSF